MFSLHDVGMQYSGRVLYNEVSLQFTSGKRYALVGANGTGKTTLLKIISGKEEPSLGEVSIPRHTELGLLDQDHFKYDDVPVLDIVFMGRPALWALMQEKKTLLEDGDFMDERTGLRLAECESKIAEHNGYAAESIAQTILIGLGIAEKYHHGPLKKLSGGMKLRVLLSQTLFHDPDILLLDEPTNHLDIESIAWLEQYLIHSYNGVLVMISHDQAFINRVATHVLDIDYGDVKLYTGNYVQFEKQKAQFESLRDQELASKIAKVEKLQRFVDRFGAKASKAKQAQSRAKMIEKIELPDTLHSSRQYPGLQFEMCRPSGETVVTAKEITHAYGDNIVLCDIGLTVLRGEKVGIIGPNGIGKSTLLKIMVGDLTPNIGETTWGYETHIGYFSQNHHEQLDDHMTVLDWLISQGIPGVNDQAARSMLGRVLITGDDVHKKIGFLSGGEAARLLLARIMLYKPNVLLFDEPTNHLDLESVQALAKALRAYKGTLIIVSHNRYFLSKVCNRMVMITHEGVQELDEEHQAMFD